MLGISRISPREYRHFGSLSSSPHPYFAPVIKLEDTSDRWHSMIKLITLENDPRTIYDCSHFIYEVFEYPDEKERPCCNECNSYPHEKQCKDECNHDDGCHHDDWQDREHGHHHGHHGWKFGDKSEANSQA